MAMHEMHQSISDFTCLAEDQTYILGMELYFAQNYFPLLHVQYLPR